MNLKEALPILAPQLRIDAEYDLAEALKKFNADALEARDLIGVILHTLRYRYKLDMVEDINLVFRTLSGALEELHYEASLDEPQDCIDAYKDSRAREAGL